MKRTVLHIAHMDCPSEEQLVRARLERMDRIVSLQFDLVDRRLTVEHDLQDERDLLHALEPLGLGANLAEAPLCDHCAPAAEPGPPGSERLRESVPMLLSGLCAFGAEAAAWATGDDHGPAVIALAVLAMASGGRRTLQKGLAALRTFSLNINFLMTIAIAGAIIIGKWPEAAMVTFLFALAEAIEERSLDRARNAVRGLMQLAPETAHALSEGVWLDVPVESVGVGRIVQVKPGERLPLDGIVTDGESTVDQAAITGESLPVDKSPGDPVYAGTINQFGSLQFEVTAGTGHTALDRIVRTIQEAQSQRAPTQRFVDRFARFYTPAVVLAALLVACVPPLLGYGQFADWLYRALVLLVIACPCALVISTPVTVVSGLTAAARCGILVKGGLYLEEGRRLRAIALDKTGTLTVGRPSVTDVIALDSMSPAEILRLAASLNAPSEHPIASAIVAHWARTNGPRSDDADAVSAKASRLESLLPVTGFQALAGRGVRGQVNGDTLYLGSHRLVEDNGVCGPDVEQLLERLEGQGKSAVVLMSETHPLGVLGVADTVRETSADAVAGLHREGVQTVLLSGDSQATTDAIARAVGITDARGTLLPDDKVAAVAEIGERHGHVGMVGDGINDAPALARANIGFAMGAAGTDTALETADVALMDDDLRKLPAFIRLSRWTASVLWQNIGLALGIKAVFLALAVAGRATLWMAVFADMGASLIVVANGLRLLRFCRGR